MEFIPAKLPLFVKRLFPNYVWNISTEEKVIYLTFDDGPTPKITHWTLHVLEQYQAKATFFCIGYNVEKHPKIFESIIENGHVIGNHTYSHPRGWKSSTEVFLENAQKAQDIIDIQLQQSITKKLFRPPYGQITKEQGRKLTKLGYKIIMWSVLAFDWSSKTTKEKCLKNVIKNAKKGSIIVFHDSEKASENMQYALPKVLEYFSKKGFKFQSITPEILESRQTLV